MEVNDTSVAQIRYEVLLFAYHLATRHFNNPAEDEKIVVLSKRKLTYVSIEPCPLPDEALLGKYVQNDNYTDCYQTEISGTVTQAQYVNAFYTTLVFKIERAILKWAVSKPSFDF